MPRVAKKKPLRGSVRQNTLLDREEEGRPFFGFGAKLALMVLCAIAAILFVAWSWHNEWPQRKAASALRSVIRLTQKTGFAVSDVLVDGRHFTDKTDLLNALDVSSGSPIFLFNPQEAHEKVMTLPWTESASVLRSLPNKIVVRLTERRPMARWQHADKTVVIDRDGKELTAAKPENFPSLPLVVGNAAPEQTKYLLDLLREYPVVAQLLKAAVRVGERRWNFYIQPNLLIRLPERNEPAALTKLTQLIQEQKVTDRNIVAIDLRLPDRMIIEPGAQPSAPQYGETSE